MAVGFQFFKTKEEFVIDLRLRTEKSRMCFLNRNADRKRMEKRAFGGKLMLMASNDKRSCHTLAEHHLACFEGYGDRNQMMSVQ